MKRKNSVSILTQRGQTSIPAAIRHQMGWKPGSKLVWRADGNIARAFAMPDDPVDALYGSLKGMGISTEELLAERRKDKARE